MFQHIMFRQGQRQPEAILRPYTVKLLLALRQSNNLCLIYSENITFKITLEMAMITQGGVAQCLNLYLHLFRAPNN